jgi:sarcosine oxidase
VVVYDVIVVGLGGMGSAAAYHLSGRGLRVLGLERFGPAHDQGASHGGSRIVRQSYFEGSDYVPLLLRSYELWRQLAAVSGRDVFRLTGGVMVGLPSGRTVAGSRRSAEQWGLRHEMLSAAEIRTRFPTMNPRPQEVALYEHHAGFVRPEETVAAHLALTSAELRFHEPMLSYRSDAAGVEVRTVRGVYTAGHLVLTPGPWAPRLLADLGVPFAVERQVQYWFAPAGGVTPFLPQHHPIYIWEDAGGRQIYGFPAIDGPSGGAKVAFFRGGTPTDPDTVDREVHDEEVRAMAQAAGRHLPGLPGRFLRAKTCLYSNTPDEHFVIARHPAQETVTVACGFSGHGFKFVPVVGEILADLATTGNTEHPIALFDPRRFHSN